MVLYDHDTRNSGRRQPRAVTFRRTRHLLRWLFYGIATFAFIWVFLSRHEGAGLVALPEALRENFKQDQMWDWSQVKEIYAFGDSWTTTDFNPDGLQPRQENPMGNPDFPNDPKKRPPDWIEYVTGVYNQSFIKTFNLARGAATIDRDILMPLFPSTWSFDEQVTDHYIPQYTTPSHALSPPPNRLFIILFGLVDVALLTREGPVDRSIIAQISTSYETNLHRLYDAGARHFLLINVAPIDRAPDPEFPLARFDAIESFNEGLEGIRSRMVEKYAPDPLFTLKLFNLYAFLTLLLEDPTLMLQTTAIKNTTANCWDYNPDVYNGEWEARQAWDYLDAEKCGVRRDQYFWANPLHVTHPVQEAIAARMVGDCFGEGELCG